MSLTTIAPVQLLDFADYHAGGSRQDMFVGMLGASLRQTGFFYLKNHGVDLGAIDAAFAALPRFFGLDEATKLRYEFPDVHHQYGYTPFGAERSEFAKKGDPSDSKEFYHFNQAKFVEVPEAPGFTAANRVLFGEFQRAYLPLMEAVALTLDLDREYFAPQVGNSLLRVIHYPAQENPKTSEERKELLVRGGNISGMCAWQHTDINVLTLLLARSKGLELLYDGHWLPMLISDPTVLIVNSGDMLWHLTGGRYLSGRHRVVCERNIARYSMPFFGHLQNDQSLVPLAHLGKTDRRTYRFKTAGEFLNHRLKQIGLAQKKVK